MMKGYLLISLALLTTVGAAMFSDVSDADTSYIQVEGTELTYEFRSDANAGWEFDDGTVTMGKNVIHTFDGSGIHKVNCTSEGCTETIVISITDEDSNILNAYTGVPFMYCIEGITGIDDGYTDASFLRYDQERSRIVGTPTEEGTYHIRLIINGESERNTRSVIVGSGEGIIIPETSETKAFTYSVDGKTITLSALDTNVLSNEWKLFDSGMKKISSDRFKMTAEFTVSEYGRYLVSLTSVTGEGSTTSYQYVDVPEPSDDPMADYESITAVFVIGTAAVLAVALLIYWRV